MSIGPLREEDLHAYADCELDSARAAAIEDVLTRDSTAASLVDNLRAQKAMLHAAYDGILNEPVPHRLARRVHAKSGSWQYAAIVASLVIGTGIGWMLRDARDEQQRVVLPRHAAAAHAVFTPEVRHAVEVKAAEEAHLVRWLSKRLGARVRVPQLNALGYELLGGRLVPEAGRPGAQFMYQDSAGRRITLYLSTDVTNRDTAFRYTRENGLHVFYWIDRELGYALSGDIDKAEILRVARAVYEQLNP